MAAGGATQETWLPLGCLPMSLFPGTKERQRSMASMTLLHQQHPLVLFRMPPELHLKAGRESMRLRLVALTA